MVLEWFWVCFGRLFGAKTMTKRQREDLWKCLFYLTNIAVFVDCGFILGCQSERPIWIKTWFYGDFGFVLRFILVATIDDNSIEQSMDF